MEDLLERHGAYEWSAKWYFTCQWRKSRSFSHYVNLKINNNLLKGVEVFDLLSDSDDSDFDEYDDDLADEY